MGSTGFGVIYVAATVTAGPPTVKALIPGDRTWREPGAFLSFEYSTVNIVVVMCVRVLFFYFGGHVMVSRLGLFRVLLVWSKLCRIAAITFQNWIALHFVSYVQRAGGRSQLLNKLIT